LAVQWISDHPWRVLRLLSGKFLYWFSVENEYVTQVTIPAIGVLSLGVAVIYYPVVVGSLLAIGSRRESVRDFAILAWIINIAAALLYAIFFTKIRYRLPFDPLLFAAASGMILEIAQGRPQAWKKVLSARSSPSPESASRDRQRLRGSPSTRTLQLLVRPEPTR
jgi:hypothetical protein